VIFQFFEIATARTWRGALRWLLGEIAPVVV
jgi:hypothetical protein